jgi:WG containing repeat
MKIRFAPIILICLNAAVVYSQPSGRKLELRHLYQVRTQMRSHLYIVANDTGRIGFMDENGRLVIGFDRLPKTTTQVGEFHEGRAVIYLKRQLNSSTETDDVAGYIDETGKIVIEPRFDEAHDFSEGLAYVQSQNLKGFIDRSGRLIIRFPKNMWARLEPFGYGFHEGRAAVVLDGETAFIDRTGKITCRGYTGAAAFSEGLAAVTLDAGEHARYGFVDPDGHMKIRAEFIPVLGAHLRIASLSRFAEGLASVRLGKDYGFIDKTGAFVIKPQFAFAGNFSEGLAFVKLGREGGYIDHVGHWVIGPSEDYLNGREFRERMAAVDFEQGWGYIDRAGKIIIAPRFLQAFEFDRGVATVQFATSLAYIDTTGNYVVPRPNSNDIRRKL